MREGSDDRSSPEVKLDLLSDLIERGYKPQLALDDDPRNLLMFWDQKLQWNLEVFLVLIWKKLYQKERVVWCHVHLVKE